jgi:signal transduction histidine kinase
VAAASPSGTGSVSSVVSAALAVIAGPLFLAGLAPPALLLAQWRLPEEAQLRDAEAGLIAATSPGEVAVALLPFVARTMGGDAAVLSRPDGSIVAYHGLEADGAEQLVAAGEAGEPLGDAPVTSIPMRTGRMSVAGDRFSPFFGRGESEVLARLGSLTDVALRRAELTETERASAAELQRAHDAMREFLSIASHDLRTPIAVIKGYAATMSSAWDALPDDDKRTFVATINRQADRLSRLVSDLLTMSQLDAGAIDPEIGQVDLADLVEEVVGDLDREGDVRIDIAGPLVVCADQDHGSRIVQNLIENAFRYGQPPVTVTATTVDGSVELRVSDQGPGVAEHFVPRLFDRFARADDAAEKAKHGTGLGLSIVRGLARAAGGEAWYEPAAPGACFAVRFLRPSQDVQ